MLTFIETPYWGCGYCGCSSATSLKGIPSLVCYLSVACCCLIISAIMGLKSVTVQPGFNRLQRHRISLNTLKYY